MLMPQMPSAFNEEQRHHAGEKKTEHNRRAESAAPKPTGRPTQNDGADFFGDRAEAVPRRHISWRRFGEAAWSRAWVDTITSP